MLKRILVPIDGTEYSWRALEYAIGLAKLSGGSLVIMTVAHEEVFSPAMILHNRGDCLVAQIGNEVLDAARVIMRGNGIEASYLLEKDGDIAEHILRIEKSEQCDAIVIGSRGFGILEGILKRSVSQSVFENADVPVIVIK